VSDACILQHQETWPIAVWCEVLDVSRRGFDASAQRQAAPGGDHEEVVLLARVRAMHTKTRPSDGSRRMAKPLQAEGVLVGRDNARRLRPAAGVVVRHRQRGPVTPDSRQGAAVAPNLWARPCDGAPSDTVWAGDLTSLWTAAGWVSVAAGLDWPSRHVVGWAMSRRIDAALVREALGLALGRRGPAPGFMQHSDRGRQDACGAYQELLAAQSIRCSMRRTGDGLDHAVVERFFGS